MRLHNDLPSPQRRWLLSAMLAASLMDVLAGCAGPGAERDASRDAERERESREELKRYAERGYRSRRHEVQTHAEVWFSESEEMAVSLVLPREPGRYPLVVYLPGMGESADGGAQWRNAWAAAGYAVLAVQPVSIAQVWSSRRARSGDVVELAQEQFADASLSGRIAAVRLALEEAQRRSSQPGPYGCIDFSRLAIAGYDLGAQTAQFLAGEQHAGAASPAPLLPGLQAVILLSPYVAKPYADAAMNGLAMRYHNIRLPVLGITGEEDVDGYEMVTTGMARQIPFQYMPAGDKYLLALKHGQHDLLSGAPIDTLAELAGAAGDAPSEREGHLRRGPGEGGSRGNTFGPGSEGMEAGPGNGGFHNERSGSHVRGDIDYVQMRADLERQCIVVQALSTAFLDAMINHDVSAVGWLRRDAQDWTQSAGRLASKQ